jgi:hypothetical protein
MNEGGGGNSAEGKRCRRSASGQGKDYIAGEEACDVVALSECLEDGANEFKPPRGGLQNDALVCRWARANNTI